MTYTGQIMCSQLQKEGSSWEVLRWVQMKTLVYCFASLPTLEYAYAFTKGQLTDDDMIRVIFAIAPEKYRAMLNLVTENQGDALQPSHLEVAMRKILCQGGGSNGLSIAKKGTEIV